MISIQNLPAELQQHIYTYDSTYKEKYDEVIEEIEYYADEVREVRETFQRECDVEFDVVRFVIDDDEFITEQGKVLRFSGELSYENWIGEQWVNANPYTIWSYLQLTGNPRDYSRTAIYKLQQLFKGKNEGQLFLMMMMSLFGDDGIDWVLKCQREVAHINNFCFNNNHYYVLLAF